MKKITSLWLTGSWPIIFIIVYSQFAKFLSTFVDTSYHSTYSSKFHNWVPGVNLAGGGKGLKNRLATPLLVKQKIKKIVTNLVEIKAKTLDRYLSFTGCEK